VELPESARAMVESGRLAHLVTLNGDGSPQVSCVWVGLHGDEIVSAHLMPRQQFPPMPDPPPGVILRISVERLGGVGPWVPPRS
jgi:hypothetical protein